MTLPLWALGAWKWLKGLPWQLWAVIGVILLAGLSYCAGERSGYAKRDAEQAEIERKAVEEARKRDAAAGDAVDQTKSEVEQGNDEARKAADGSDDPLKSGLDSLRD